MTREQIDGAAHRVLVLLRDDSSLALADLALDLVWELRRLQRLNEGLTERIAAQSDLLTRAAERRASA